MKRLTGICVYALCLGLALMQWGCMKDEASSKGSKMILSVSPCDCVEDWAASLETFDAFQRVFNNKQSVSVTGDLTLEVWNDDTKVYFKVYRLNPALTFGNIRINNGAVTGFNPAVNSYEWEMLIDTSWEECHAVDVNLKLGGVGGAGGNVEGDFSYTVKAKCCFECGVATVTDIDNNVYNTVQIGTQCWMKENLKTTTYNDGSPIPNVTGNIDWSILTTPAYCWYANDYVNYGSQYGALYNWYTVETGKLCPTGWHVPTDAEWTTLYNCLGGFSFAGGKLKESGTTHWASPNTGATNLSGFTALPGCARYYNSGTFNRFDKTDGYWWSSTAYSTTTAWYRTLNYYSSYFYFYTNYKNYGFSVRCVMD